MAVSTDKGNDAKVRRQVKNYVLRKGITFINLLDPKSVIASQYGVPGIPMTFLITPQRKFAAFVKENIIRIISVLKGRSGV